MRQKNFQKEETYRAIPFTTLFQEEAQKIVKELWQNQEAFLNTHGKRWINQKPASKMNKKFPTVLIYSKIKKGIDDKLIYECEDEYYVEKGFHVEIVDFENYSPVENRYINIIGTDNEELKGISLVAIMDILRYSYLEISNFHEKIIKIYKSNLDINVKKYCIKSIIEEIDCHIDKNSYKFNFKYSTEVIQSLNIMFKNEDKYSYEEKHEWIVEGDSFIAYLALEAYQKITYYSEWLDRHRIEHKHFKEKKENILTRYKEVIAYMDIKPPYAYGNIPEHPQDILYELVFNYLDYYKREEEIKDKGIQEIIKIISDYDDRMPKKSKDFKNNEFITKIQTMLIEVMRHHGATVEEMMDWLSQGRIKENMLQKIKEEFLEIIRDISPEDI